MIGSLRGTLLELTPPTALLETQGVGYLVTFPLRTCATFQPGQEIFCYIHDHIREDARTLYGFLERTEREFFELLLGVSGVGPKVALLLLSIGSADAIRQGIAQGDLHLLTSVPGVGKKTAQKIILELKGQLVESSMEQGPTSEVVDALVSMGYSASQAHEAIRLLPPDLTDVSERIRFTLKILAP